MPDPSNPPQANFSQPFVGDVQAGMQFRMIVREYGIKTIIETGTFQGLTTRFLASIAPHVVTIEIDPKVDSSHLSQVPNVQKLLMPSPEGIRQAVTLAPPPYLFYLDAHWEPPTPTPHELDVIASLGLKPVIVIHDFKVPSHPELGFDSYSDWTNDIEHVEPHLKKIYGEDNYLLAYNNPAPTVTRGILYVAPAPE
jgi:hypothetical protein